MLIVDPQSNSEELWSLRKTLLLTMNFTNATKHFIYQRWTNYIC